MASIEEALALSADSETKMILQPQHAGRDRATGPNILNPMMNLLRRHLPTFLIAIVVLSACVTTAPARPVNLEYDANTSDADVVGVAEVETAQGWVEIETTVVEPTAPDRTHALRTEDLAPGTYNFRVWNLRVTDNQRSEIPTNEAGTEILPRPPNPAGLLITQITVEIAPDGQLRVI